MQFYQKKCDCFGLGRICASLLVLFVENNNNFFKIFIFSILNANICLNILLHIQTIWHHYSPFIYYSVSLEIPLTEESFSIISLEEAIFVVVKNGWVREYVISKVYYDISFICCYFFIFSLFTWFGWLLLFSNLSFFIFPRYQKILWVFVFFYYFSVCLSVFYSILFLVLLHTTAQKETQNIKPKTTAAVKFCFQMFFCCCCLLFNENK